MHLEQEQIERLLHGELTPEGDRDAHAHLAGCEECRTRLDDARLQEQEVLSLFTHLDSRAPHITAATVIERARRPWRVPLRWAAGVVLALGAAGAAVAVPGSPLRTWWNSRAQTQAESTISPAPNPDRVAGIAVAPGDYLVIAFQSTQARGFARIELIDTSDVVVVSSTNSSATFTSGADRLLIENSGATGSYQVQIPRTARHVEIVLAGRSFWLKQGARVSTPVPAQSAGVFVLDLQPTDSR